MKKWLIMLVLVAVCFASVTKQAWPIDDQNEKGQGMTFTDRTLIAVSGDIRSILGPGGKSIAVSASGDAIAVIYGDPTGDPNNYMEIYIAYSLDGGSSWTTYGPHSAELRRLYPGLDGSPDFDVNPGELYFEWQESPNGYDVGDLKCMIEENVPSAPSFSSPVSMTNASGAALCPWLGTVAANVEDPYWVITDAWSYLNNGNQAVYFWVSEDGGYTWSDTIRALDPIDAGGCTGHARFGSGDYVHYIYQDLKTIGSFDVVYPYYLESTDGGYTWSSPTAMPDVPMINAENAQFWWHEFDLEVVNDEIWHVENDINQVFPDSGGFWCWHGTGSPGSWTWDVFNIVDYTFEQTTGGYYYLFQPNQYPSVCHDPVSGMIAVTFKAYYILINTTTNDTLYDGTHVGAIYTMDNGTTWTVSAPLSTPDIGNQLINWNATETAHLLVNDGQVWAYTVWIEDVTFNTYFEVGRLVPFVGVAEMENDVVSYNFSVRPNITTNRCEAVFNMPVSGTVGVKLYDATGRLIENIYEGNLAQGNQTINVNTADLATGTYFVVLDTEAGSDAQKIIKVH
ncbi:MAG: T9SS type A sorting domain-containing protein [candidate division WOR-3 bacterium]|nr:MAG: T9SS type A sorting domain-containing protein [candidate division WOR-3 bacterium]